MGRRDAIIVPPRLRPLLDKPSDWPAADAWRITAAACRASGAVAWAARLEPPSGQPVWFEAGSPSRPAIVQSECVDALVAALQATPPGAAVEIIAPTSLRYLVEGASFPPDTPEHHLSQLASQRRVWARYALGEDLEAPVAECLARAYTSLAPLRWPGEAALGDAVSVVYTDGGCTRDACASAWVLRRGGVTLAEQAWRLPGAVERDGVRLAEFLAAAEGLAAAPAGAEVAVVTDHADVSDFGVRGVPAFRPSPGVARVLSDLRERAASRQVRWYWAARSETAGQRRCQTLIDRHLRAATARARFLDTCRAAGLRRLFLPDFEVWLAPREPLVADQPGEEWAATFERGDRYLAADPTGPRVYLRQLRLPRQPPKATLAEAFARSRAAGWCQVLRDHPPLAGAAAARLGQLRAQLMLALLFEPDVALLVQTRPGASLDDVLDAAGHVREVRLA